jgi:hypothetical protein
MEHAVIKAEAALKSAFHKPFNSLPFSGEAKEPQTLSPLFF